MDGRFEISKNVQQRIKAASQIISSVDALLADPDHSNLRAILRLRARSLGLLVSH